MKPISPALTENQERQLQALLDELEALEETGDRTEQDETRRDLVIRSIADLENRSPVFDEAQKTKARVFISLRDDGLLLIDRGYIRHKDAADDIRDRVHVVTVSGHDNGESLPANFNGTEPAQPVAAIDEDEDATGLPDRLMIELTAYHSLALRDALANDPGTAFLAMLHALTLRLFYHYTTDTCLQVEAKDTLTSPFPGLADFPASAAIATRHHAWEEALPEKPEDLWHALQSLDADNRKALFAHCAGLTINAVFEPGYRVSQKRRHAFQLAEALRLDMTQAGWITRADNYLNRVTKAGIVAAVREAKGDATAELLTDLKKKDMAVEAERLLDGTGWLPETKLSLKRAQAPQSACRRARLCDRQLRSAFEPGRDRCKWRSHASPQWPLCPDLPARNRLGQRRPHPHLRRTQGLHRRSQSLRATLMARRYPAIGASLPRRARRRPPMKLLTKELHEKLLANGREQAKVKGTKGEKDFPPVVKFFYPAGNQTWLLTELDPEDEDVATGLCDLGMGCRRSRPS